MNHATHPVAWMAYAVMLLCIAHQTLLPRCASAQIVINEFMAAPGSGEPEWIELFNDSDQPVDLEDWVVHDRGSSRPKLPQVTIPAGGYLLLTKDTTGLRNRRNITGPLVRVSLPALNNGGDDLVLLDTEGTTIDSVPYLASWGVSTGVSLERIRPDRPSTRAENWGSSTDTTGATPGGRNSISPLDNDLSIGTMLFDTESGRLVIPVLNSGRRISSGGVLTIFEDRNGDGVGETEEILSGRTLGAISSGDSSLSEFLWSESIPITGRFAIAVITALRDDDRRNDTARLLLLPPYGRGGPVINEFMADPEDDEPEWVELYNGEDRPVNLAGWVLHDAGSARPEIPGGTLDPHSYATLTSDTAGLRRLRPETPGLLIELPMPTLNNGGDLILLRRPDGVTIDSFRYSGSWGGGDGLSLERRDPKRPATEATNWRTTLDPSGGTPGRVNSMLPGDTAARNLRIDAVTYDGVEEKIVATILSTGIPPVPDGLLVVSSERQRREIAIGGDAGKIVLEVPWNLPSGLEMEIVTLLIRSEEDERPDDDTARLEVRGIEPPREVIITEFMAAPLDDRPEWIELYNRSAEQVDLLAWQVADGTTTSPPLPAHLLPPATYVVVTGDSASLIERFPRLAEEERHLIEVSLPSLNNSGDIVKLIDSHQRTIDSLRYGASWLPERGRSLERKQVVGTGLTADDWAPSPAPTGGTPGEANGWRPIVVDLAILEMRRVEGERSEVDTIAVRIAQRGEGVGGENGVPETCGVVLGVDHDRNQQIDEGEEILRRSHPLPSPEETLEIVLPWNRSLRSEGESALIVVEVEGEERPEDNIASLEMQRAPLDSGLVINELMFEPGDDEPEWIELYNRTEERIDLADWIIHDAGTARPRIASGTIEPHGYVLLTSDSTTLATVRPVFSTIIEMPLPTLNNSGDLLVLHAPNGRIVDSLEYRRSWATRPGASLERRYVDRTSNDSAHWGSSIDGGGGTPGWENSILPAGYDLRLEEAHFVRDRSAVSLRIVNAGRNEVTGAEARLYYDADEDSQIDEGELERVEVIGRILPEEMITLELPWDRELRPEGELGLAAIDLPQEERPEDNILPFTPRAALGSEGILINEFLAAPASNGVEWIELLNIGALPVDLDGWSLADGASDAMVEGRGIMPPGSFALLTSDTARLRSAYRLPIGTLLIELSLPALNNGADEITLRNTEESTIDHLAYDGEWELVSATSLERKHPLLPSEEAESWGSSIDPERGTPGRANSVSIPERDLAIDSVAFDPLIERIVLLLRNRGLQAIEGGDLLVLLGEEEIASIPLGPLTYRQEITLEIAPPLELSDTPTFLRMALHVDGDEDASNDTGGVTVFRTPADEGVIITELMVDPLPVGEERGAEYIELYNVGERIVSLEGWSIVEGSDGRITLGGERSTTIPVGSYALIASDSTLFDRFPGLRDSARVLVLGRDLGLNNTGDRVRLRNRADLTIDSVPYNDEWHVRRLHDTRGISLERIRYEGIGADSLSWSSSVDRRGGTPLGENSRRLQPIAGETGELRLSSGTISPDGDGREDFLRIAWSLPVDAASITITLYDREGWVAARPLENRLLGGTGETIWDGTDREGTPLPIGPYLLHLEAWPVDTTTPIVLQRVVVVARRW